MAKKALLGFDGYVDMLYRVLSTRSAAGKVSFRGIADFGGELAKRAGKSGGYELDKLSVRFGGNAPLMASALAGLGVDAAVVGSMGLPGLDPAFEGLGKRARLLSVAPPALTVALEFDDGKIMLGDTQSLEGLDWTAVENALGLEALRAEVAASDLIALVNWANMAGATSLWKGLLENVLARDRVKNKVIFFDLADIARCGVAETLELVAMLPRFKAHGRVALGLNENEALQLADKLSMPHGSMEDLGSRLHARLGLDCLVIHPRGGAYTFEGATEAFCQGRVVNKPMISTGGGDHFNGGFCEALLEGKSASEAAKRAVLVSSLYVEKGQSPSQEDVLGYSN